MILDWQSKYGNYSIYGMPCNLSAAPNGIKVSTHALHTVFEPYKNSWGTMVTLLTPMNSAARETSLPTSIRFFQLRTSPQGNTN